MGIEFQMIYQVFTMCQTLRAGHSSEPTDKNPALQGRHHSGQGQAVSKITKLKKRKLSLSGKEVLGARVQVQTGRLEKASPRR